MKKYFSLQLCLLSNSCSESRPENKPLVENTVDNTDSSLQSSFKSSRYDDNMIELKNLK